MRLGLATGAALVAALLLSSAPLTASALADGGARASATCSDYENQADAQRAGDTRDADGDGVYCESLPCPCLRPGGGGGESPAPRRRPTKRTQVIDARVTSVVDGDTIKVRAYRPRRRSYTVRLIGIDTPETRRPGTPVECGGPEASRSMKRLARRGARVRLTTDPSQDTTDRYGRLLAYAQIGRRQLNVTMISRGWAKVYVYRGKRFRQYSRFARAERRARRAERGVWGQCGGDFHTTASALVAARRSRSNTVRVLASGRVSYVGRFRPGTRDNRLRRAIRAYGRPSRRRPVEDGEVACDVYWRGKGIVVKASNFGLAPPGTTACDADVGNVQDIHLRGSAARSHGWPDEPGPSDWVHAAPHEAALPGSRAQLGRGVDADRDGQPVRANW